MWSALLCFLRHNPCAFFFLSVCAAFFIFAPVTDRIGKENRP